MNHELGLNKTDTKKLGFNTKNKSLNPIIIRVYKTEIQF